MKPVKSPASCRLPDKRDLALQSIAILTQLVNRVYDEAESGMWKPGALRTTPGQVELMLAQKALLLAEHDGSLVGAVNVNTMENGIGEFGMSVADPACRGKGIGSLLVKAAEDWARGRHCRIMRLELLTPRSWQHPSKEFLKSWYQRIGYAPQHTEPFEKLHPEKLQQLATECDYTVWHKRL